MTFSLTLPHTTPAAESLRVGIVGCDTSHAEVFTKLINDPAAVGPLSKIQVTCAFPGGSPDIPDSRNRLKQYTDFLRSHDVAILNSPEEVAAQSDAILIESLDGRVHLDQFRRVAAGKPVFVDKPAAGTLADVISLFRIAEQTHTPCFSSSALRFCDRLVELKNDKSLGKIVGCSVASPYTREPHHPDLFWYGVHGVESVYMLMGTGCATVSRFEGEGTTVVVGHWSDGRLATYTGLKDQHDYAFTAFGAKGLVAAQGFSGYEPHVRQVGDFFLSGKAPVSPEETIEIFAFMEAADESLKNDGRPVAIKDVIKKAQQQAAQ